jgi:hypothetical protein
MRDVRRQFWVESVAAVVTGVMFVVTALWPDWIERGFEAEPDGGSGALEWILVGALALVTVTLGLLARAEWVRARPQATTS